MCGICGQIRFDGQAGSVDLVLKMRKSLRHRGPDDEGFWHTDFCGGGIAVGHTRLSIIDLSPNGRQPLLDSSKRYCIVYNGEVYNYKELRDNLTKKGYIFKSRTDTEVVLNAYIEYGSECLELFNGMYAFAIWDNKKMSLFCGRDRFGIKPFFYKWQDDKFYFASEAKALLLASKNAPEISDQTVYDYLSLGLTHHRQHTFFNNVHKLPGGSFLLLDHSGLSIQRYWHFPEVNKSHQCNPDWDELKTLFYNAVQLRLRSDVPVGILLSGGLDSSAIAAMAAGNNGTSPVAFSLKFDNDDIDESPHAEMVASHCNTTLRLLEPRGSGLWEELDNLIKSQDAPTHAPEVYSNWCMMRAVARCNIKVLLSGQGGDELFAGYNWYPKYFLASLARKGKLYTLISELTKLPKNFPNPNTNGISMLMGGMLHALLPIAIKLKMKPELRCLDKILHRQVSSQMRKRDTDNLRLLDPSGLEQKLFHDLNYCNIPHYLHYEDANSMTFGIEERVPFLDHRVVEWAFRLPVWWKMHDGLSKLPLRRIMKGILPEPIVDRKDKIGLSAPKDHWFRNELRAPINALFSTDCRIFENWVDRKIFLNELDVYMRGKVTPLNRLLWRCINLEKWLRIYT
jgi:asparagine synthase (glutamine-hydrolysing)